MKQEPSIRVIHLRREGSYSENTRCYSSKGGITIAYSWAKQDTYITLATAVCSDDDIFSRFVGNKIAMGNLLSGECIRIPFPRDAQKFRTPTDVIRTLFSEPLNYVQ